MDGWAGVFVMGGFVFIALAFGAATEWYAWRARRRRAEPRLQGRQQLRAAYRGGGGASAGRGAGRAARAAAGGRGTVAWGIWSGARPPWDHGPFEPGVLHHFRERSVT